MSDENNNEVRESLSHISAIAEEETNPDPVDAYLSTFPPGYRFAPTDQEIIVHYLTTKVEDKVLPVNKINQVNLYDHTPEYLTSEIFKSYEDVWYYYTSRDRKYRNGIRPNRSAGDGYWKATGVDKKIKSEDGTDIGSKKTLVFYRGKAPKGDKSDWIMHEFRVEQSQFEKNSRADMMLDNYVLCRIYNKGTTKSKTKRAQSEAATATAETTTTQAEEETTSTMDRMEYLNEEEEEGGALNMIIDEAAAAEVATMSSVFNDHSTSMMDPFTGSIFDDPLPSCIQFQTYHPTPLSVQINNNYMCATAIDNFSTYGSSSHMQWYNSSVFPQHDLQLDYNDMMSSLSGTRQVPPSSSGNNYGSREQVFKQKNNDNIYAAGWSGSTTTVNVIPNYCQDQTYRPDYVLRHR